MKRSISGYEEVFSLAGILQIAVVIHQVLFLTFLAMSLGSTELSSFFFANHFEFSLLFPKTFKRTEQKTTLSLGLLCHRAFFLATFCIFDIILSDITNVL